MNGEVIFHEESYRILAFFDRCLIQHYMPRNGSWMTIKITECAIDALEYLNEIGFC